MSIPISKTLDDIRTDIFGKIQAVQQDGRLPENVNLNRGPFRGLIELWAWGLYQLYSFLVLILGEAFPSMASGVWLDLHCEQVDITRKQETKATGTVYFTRSDTEGNVPIAAGRVIKTKPDGLGNVYRFITDSDVVLADGSAEIAATVTAEEYGAASNVVTGQITEIVTAIPGVDAVENRSDWLITEGADTETDESLRERYKLKWMELNGATKYAYISWAKSVSGVVEVAIQDQHPRGQGTVNVLLKGTAGLPTASLISDVDAVVQANKPINDDVLVAGPDAVNVTVTGEIEFTAGTAAEAIAEAENRINAFFAAEEVISGIAPVQIGQDVPLDKLTWLVMQAEGVKKVTFSSPSADIQVDEDELAVLSSMSFTASEAGEV